MTTTDLSTLPDEARLWVFGVDRPLDAGETARLEAELAPFIVGWSAHRADLPAGFRVHEDRFLLVAVDEARVAASGCSIDALLHELARLEKLLGASLRDGGLIWYRDSSGSVVSCSREEFRRLAAEGVVDGRTPVFDLTIERLADLRGGRLERPAAESWHGRLIDPSAAAAAGRRD